MIKINSKVKDAVLHLVYRPDNDVEMRTELVDPDQFIQCSYLKMNEGQTFKPHKHIWKTPNYKRVIAQELLETHILNAGDSSFTLEGGHTYEILEDHTLVYEYKTGPYEGQELDKVFL